MRFWIVFPVSNAVFAWLPVLLSRLGHGRSAVPKGCKHFLQIYIAAILGLTLTRLAGVQVIQLIGDAMGGAGATTFFGLTLALPTVLVAAALWAWTSRRAQSQGT